ncbi:helix-turn-helix transcriptional regulator [Actinoplanes derwentensis]|uniref:DNA-binding response regulator, NarL/FixJ family, contains REC and HTH domains n=1 Tax=Actinoplanes derwentensis TaxID=113562 RepID=A0A1H1X370_9ACTN|nr:LuxR C-terminal-related transcriptional regulator [Actinoplanes derwentensis]GID85740.1 helix-turn-helix transcriptional regulator [Actinoplanes derwentensis]SDT03511.1 DNA-binding response regulator, NarL/FixJ family, contains REC and HTH domains [Actinoplanes derwentensis]
MSVTGTPERIPVTVHGDDPLVLAGLTHHLRASPLIEVRNPMGAGQGPTGVAVTAVTAVAVLATERIEEPVLGALSRTGPVVLVVPRLSESELLTVLDSGVAAVLYRHEVTAGSLRDAVRTAARHGRELPNAAVGQLIDTVLRLRRESATPAEDIRPPRGRELDVLRLLADGLETREIAQLLDCSERTVKNVLHGVTARFRLRNRTHAVAYALRAGYL